MVDVAFYTLTPSHQNPIDAAAPTKASSFSTNLMNPEPSSAPSPAPGDVCPSCGASRPDSFCGRCGEKRLDPDDASVRHHLADAWESLVQFDGKFLRSLRQLVNPGKITQDHFAGRRIKILKPLQLFLLINVVYFFALEYSDIFFNRWSTAKTQTILGVSIQSMGEAKLKRTGLTEAELANKHNATAPQLSRALVLALIPLVALGSWALFGRSKPYLSQHLTFSAHALGFMLLWMMTWILTMKFFFKIYRGPWVWDPIAYGLLIWLVVACRRAFAEHWLGCVGKAVLFLWLIQWLQFNVYRNFISALSIWWL